MEVKGYTQRGAGDCNIETLYAVAPDGTIQRSTGQFSTWFNKYANGRPRRWEACDVPVPTDAKFCGYYTLA